MWENTVIRLIRSLEKLTDLLEQIDRSQTPPTLSYCCHDRQTMPLSHYTSCSHAVKNTSQSKEETDNTLTEKTAGYFWHETRSQDPQLLNWIIFKEIQTINTILWLFNMLWQITVLPQFKHVNRSSFHIYLKHEMNMNKHQKVFYFNLGTHHFSSLSPPKLIYSSVWFVVKARRDTAAATGHAHLHIFLSQRYKVKPMKMVLKKYIAP